MRILQLFLSLVLASMLGWMGPDVVQAQHLEPPVVDFIATAGPPPLPFSRPVIGPSWSLDYHQHRAFPTTTEKWIDVSLAAQRVVAYEGTRPVRAFTVSTGLPNTPTVQGEFRIWIKTRIQDMSGGNRAAGDTYYLPDVEWVQYFYGDYGFHGTYWHNNFGQPMSRGCINMTNEDAQWLFEWTSPAWDPDGPTWQQPSPDSPGTLVIVRE